MAKRITFEDRNGNVLSINGFLNNDNELFISCGEMNESHTMQYVCLDENDVLQLIKELQQIKKLF